MKQQLYVLPVRCGRCNAVFDLWYDLQRGQQDVRTMDDVQTVEHAMRDHLCWRCRKDVAVKIVENTFDADDDLDDIFNGI